MTAPWPAIAAARAARVPRVPFLVVDRGAAVGAGSVARAHLEALARWPEALRVDDAAVTLTLPAAERDRFFDQANRALRDAGLIVAWRDETYPVLAEADGRLLATFERAASRFWGTLTFGAHCNGYVRGSDGAPAWLWIARRAADKPTDPGMLDNLIGGGVPHGQTPVDTVVREGWEEAGLQPAQMAGLEPGRVLQLARDIPEGFQNERLSVYDLALPAGLEPCNQDGEVQSITRMPLADAFECAVAGEMTVDAALATLDFALRRRLLDHRDAAGLEVATAGLWFGQAAL
jgi:8-oxo-dGTP pyrophosphatase MutT (NUDIX family)